MGGMGRFTIDTQLISSFSMMQMPGGPANQWAVKRIGGEVDYENSI